MTLGASIPIALPLPRGDTEPGRAQLVSDWLLAKLWVRDYTRRLGAYQAARGGVPDAKVQAANALLVPIAIELQKADAMINGAIIESRAHGRWDDGWPNNAHEIFQLAIDAHGSESLGFAWAAILIPLIKALSVALVLASLAVVLGQFTQLARQLPDIETAGEAVGEAAEKVGKGSMMLGLGAAGVALLLWLGGKK